MKKWMHPVKKKFGVIGSIAVSLLLIIMIVANIGLTRYADTITYYWSLNKQVTDGNSSEASEEEKTATFNEARDVTKEAASEGVTLLKNTDDALPMDTDKINVFGYRSVDIVYGGAGSGTTSGSAENETLKESFENEGLTINEDLWDYYSGKYTESAEWDVFNPDGADFSVYDSKCTEVSEHIDTAKEFSNTAVVVLSRVGGEGQDCPLDMSEYTDVGGDEGKHYLEIQNCEQELLDLVKENFDHVIVLINSSHAMELGFLEDEGIDAALQIAGPGATGLRGVADVLMGTVNPSGHLVDTYAYDLKSAPSYYNMGDCTYTDYDTNMSNKYFYFEENIYTGYRWYETAAAEGTVVTVGDTTYDYKNYDSIVQYPFGYGLSYTTFDWKLTDSQADGQGGSITCKVEVTNTGDTAGKDVVQLYYSAPYTKGGIEKSAVNLGAFAKTDELQPGESQTLELTMVFDDMASFDEKGNGCYVMDEGTYTFTLRTDAHTVKEGQSFHYDLDKQIIYNEENDGKRSTDETAAVVQDEFRDAATLETNMTYLSRADFAGTFPKLERRLNPTSIPAEVKTRLEANGPGSSVMDMDDDSVEMPALGADNGLTINDMIGLDYDDEKWDDLLDQLTLDELTVLCGNSGWSTPQIDSIEKPETVDIDGPQGLNGFSFNDLGLKMNTYVSEVLMGMTWNVELVEKMGGIYGQEAINWGISGLYAPAMNTHRSPFGGRNFEYFSEDPTHAGLFAAAEVAGLQEQGVYVYAKHYLLNTQDTNRDGVANWCNEQALREVYARPFELAVKNGECTGLMTELGRIGTSWSGATYALCTVLPRDEWGMKGKVITDGVGPGGSYYMLPDYALRSGNDMMLTKASGDCGFTSATLKSGYGVTKMRESAKNILYVYANSEAPNMYTYEGGFSNWMWFWILGDIVLAAGMIVLFICLPYRAWCCNKKKEDDNE